MPKNWLTLRHAEQERTYTCTAACARIVLRFLGQPVPQDLHEASLEGFWTWAIANWDLKRVGAGLCAPAP